MPEHSKSEIEELRIKHHELNRVFSDESAHKKTLWLSGIILWFGSVLVIWGVNSFLTILGIVLIGLGLNSLIWFPILILLTELRNNARLSNYYLADLAHRQAFTARREVKRKR